MQNSVLGYASGYIHFLCWRKLRCNAAVASKSGRAYGLVSMGVGKQPFGNSRNPINFPAANWDKENFRSVNLYFMVCRMVSPGMSGRDSV